MIAISLLQGVVVLVIVMGVYWVSMLRGQGENEARALAFTSLIVANLGLIMTNRSWTRTVFSTLRTPNAAVSWVFGGAIIFMAIVLFVPAVREIFRFSYLHVTDILICIAAGVVSIVWFEIFKFFRLVQPNRS